MSRIGPADPKTGCAEWTAGKTVAGYGRFTENYVPQEAHRLAYALEYGEVPVGAWVLHSCDNPPCCNPHHLRLGTVYDNNADRTERGRAPAGEFHPLAKLTEETVAEARAAVRAGLAPQDVASRYGLSVSATYAMLKGVTWRHVPEAVTLDKATHQVRGEAASLTMLTAWQVVEARRRYQDTDATLTELASEYGVKKSTMRQAVTGKTWAHLPGAVPAGSRGHTGPTGERSGTATLTADQVREIRLRAAAGEAQAALARAFGVGQGAVSKIVRRERWAHID